MNDRTVVQFKNNTNLKAPYFKSNIVRLVGTGNKKFIIRSLLRTRSVAQ